MGEGGREEGKVGEGKGEMGWYTYRHPDRQSDRIFSSALGFGKG